MDTSLFLAQLIGVYSLIAGIAVFLRRKTLMQVFREGLEDHSIAVFVIALFELLAGLSILLTHFVWEWNYQGLITFIGAWMIIEAIIFVTVPLRITSRFIAFFNRLLAYTLGTLLFCVFGLYLTLIGFGFL